ncbi:MAG: hypothetical protein HC869_09550 [Rhodospirillales bacterium]|nr:hypothetical protein [Rhodospirillales bacterium]
MALQKARKLNWLQTHLPEGLVVDAAWLAAHGYSRQLIRDYVRSGWLEQPAARIYKRPSAPLVWEQVVISLQTLLARNLAVGGRSALELHGFGHYVPQAANLIHLYGAPKPPSWLDNVLTEVQFRWHNDARLFIDQRVSTEPHTLNSDGRAMERRKSHEVRPWGPWNWPLVISTPERAILELLDEVPERENFHHVDMLMEGLSTLSPSRLQLLLGDCRNIKVKRLFFFFADRHKHAWLKRLDRSAINLGRGNRMLVKGGVLSAPHMITVPRDLDAVQ